MLAFILQAGQQAHQALPNVFVTVQQPSSAMPEWVKILITAGVGAIVGIGSSLLMEFAKPEIAARQKRRLVRQHAVAEVQTAVDALRAYGAEVGRIEDGRPRESGEYNPNLLTELYGAVKGISFDRVEYFLENEKAIMYDLPEFPSLLRLKKLVPELIERTDSPERMNAQYWTDGGCEAGDAFLKANEPRT